MKKKQKIVTASVTVLAAVATAHLMQRGSQAGPSLTEPAPIEIAALAPSATQRPPIMLPQSENPVTVLAPAVAPRPAGKADRPAAREDRAASAEIPPSLPGVLTGMAGMDAADAMPEGIDMAADKALPKVSGDIEAADDAGPPVPEGADPIELASAFPGLPIPPEEGAMPKPLPPLGPELQDRMSAVETLLEDAAPEPDAAEPVRRNAFGLSCGALLTASARDAAMVSLTLTDPCRSEEVFTLRHGPLVFTDRTDSLGTYAGQVPALDADARFVIEFQDGTQVEADVAVPEAAEIERVAMLGTARTGLGIHALEFGADYNQSGHVWAGQTRDPEIAARLGGGFMTLLGDSELPDARLAEIYTFPANTRQREGVVRLSVEVEVSEFNCGKDIAGNTLQRGSRGRMAPVALTLAMPDCDAIGEFLVLKNLLRDLKVASN